MPARSRKRKRSRSTARRRGTLKQRMSRRPIKPLALKPHTFCERIGSQFLTVEQASTASGIFRNFVFDDIPQAASYKELFEYYTINKIVATFRYKSSGVSAAGGATGNQQWNEVNPLLYFKVDHNDNDSDTLVAMKESMKTREKQLTNDKPEFSIQFKPAIQAESYRTALTSGYTPKWGQAIATSDGLVPHFGLKAYAVGPNTTVGITWGQVEVEYKMYFTMKNNE